MKPALIVSLILLSLPAFADPIDIQRRPCAPVAARNHAEYRAGVDARGMDVAPADLHAPIGLGVGEHLQSDLGVPLRHGDARLDPLTTIHVGTLEVQDDDVTLDGQPLASADCDPGVPGKGMLP